MSIPKYHEIMLPMLKLLLDGNTREMKEVVTEMAKHFDISDDERKELSPSGLQRVFDNRVGWAKTYLKKAVLVESPNRGVVIITNRGKEVLSEDIIAITPKYLKRFDEFKEFQTASKKQEEKETTKDDDNSDETPEERLDSAYTDLRAQLVDEIRGQLKEIDPFYFEQVVIDLLINMGYGGSRKEAGIAFKSRGDGGIDGTVKEDKLGLDTIYVQAKRWKEKNNVGRPDIQQFVGALHGKRARKGIFITTSDFSKEAYEYVTTVDQTVILMNGKDLGEYMIDSGTGVSKVTTYEVKKIDLDYFQSEA
jgi:restriction system protein